MSELHVTAVAALPTQYGNFQMESFRSEDGTEPHLALSMGLDLDKVPVVRIHSECITGDVLVRSDATAGTNFKMPCAKSARRAPAS